jgi:hypothetical protein
VSANQFQQPHPGLFLMPDDRSPGVVRRRVATQWRAYPACWSLGQTAKKRNGNRLLFPDNDCTCGQNSGEAITGTAAEVRTARGSRYQLLDFHCVEIEHFGTSKVSKKE